MHSHRRSNLLIAGFILFQVLYPIRGVVEDKFDTWGNFTWNMYSQTYECRTRYRLMEQSGVQQDLDLKQYFVIPAKIGQVLNRENLPVLHQFLCEQLVREGKPGRILGRVSCTKNKVETEALVRENEDICTASNHAVTVE
jgi:hypothetical protein